MKGRHTQTSSGTGFEVAELLTGAGYRVSTSKHGPIRPYGQILALHPDES
jgi:hypothetical protein